MQQSLLSKFGRRRLELGSINRSLLSVTPRPQSFEEFLRTFTRIATNHGGYSFSYLFESQSFTIMARGRIELPTRGFSEADTDFATDCLRFDLFAVTPKIRRR